jgi:hypothetical protein
MASMVNKFQWLFNESAPAPAASKDWSLGERSGVPVKPKEYL